MYSFSEQHDPCSQTRTRANSLLQPFGQAPARSADKALFLWCSRLAQRPFKSSDFALVVSTGSFGSMRLCFALLYEVLCYSSCIAVVLQFCTSSVRCREIKAHGLKMLGPLQACSRCPCSLLSSRTVICCRTRHGFEGLERPWHLWLAVSQYAQCQMR